MQHYPYGNHKKKNSKKRINYIRQKATLLPNPQLTKTWAHYLSILRGKLLSYFTNATNQEKIIFEQLQKQEDDYNKLQQKLEVYTTTEPLYKEQITALTQSLKELNKLRDRIIEEKTLDALPLYLNLLTNFKLESINLYQKIEPKDKEEQITIDQKYKELFKKIRLPVQLVGHAKYNRFEKFELTPKIIVEGLEVLDQLEQTKTQSNTEIP